MGCFAAADLEDMLREVEIMERLKGHPNVVSLICYHNGAEDFIVVMSKAVGGDGASRRNSRRCFLTASS